MDSLRNLLEKHPSVLGVFVMASSSGIMLCGYEILRSVSISLFIDAYGANRLPWIMAGSPVVLLGLVYLYGRVLSATGPARALVLTSILFAAVLAGCAWGLARGFRPAAAVLYAFREGYVVLLIEQYWSFINSVLSESQARKVNGPIVGVSSLGSILGGVLAHQLAPRLGSNLLILVGALSLPPAALLSAAAYRIGREPRPTREEAGGRRGQIGVRELFRTRTLVGLAAVIWLTQMVSTVFDLRFNTLVAVARPAADARTSFFGAYYAILNTAAAGMQFLVAPLLLRTLSLRSIHRAIPLVHVVAAAVLLFRSTLGTAAAALLLFKVLDYSVFRAAKEIFYLPLSFDARYRSKQLVDSFGYRVSKATTSGAVALATQAAGTLPGAVFPLTALGASGLWCLIAGRLAGRYEAEVQSDGTRRGFAA